MNRNSILLGYVLIGLVEMWGCTGIPGMVATQVGGQFLARGTQSLSDQIFGPPWWQTAAQQQYQAQRVECRTIEGKEYCRPVPIPVAPVPALNSPPSRKLEQCDPNAPKGDYIGKKDCLSSPSQASVM